jgi:superfamily II DNA/RNA helicase
MLLLKSFIKPHLTTPALKMLCRSISALPPNLTTLTPNQKFSLHTQITRNCSSDFLASYAEGSLGEKPMSTEEQEAILKEMSENQISITKGRHQEPVLDISPLTDFQSQKKFDIFSKTLQEMNFTTPTPIQKYAVPVALNKQDLIGIAKTGSGKTLAFMMPAIQTIKHFKHKVRKNTNKFYDNKNKPIGLVMGPTRELVFSFL